MTTEPTIDRAITLLDLRRPAEAERDLRRILASEPERIDALILLSHALLQLDNPMVAIGAALRATRLAPDSDDAFLALANAYIEMGDAHGAWNSAMWTVHLAPHAWTSHAVMARAMLMSHEAREHEVLAAAGEAVRLAPYASEAHNVMGICLRRFGHSWKAREAFGEALRLDPQNTYAVNNLAAVSVDNFRLGHGLRLLRTVAADPELHVARSNMDVVLIQLTLAMCLVMLATTVVEGALLFSEVARGPRLLVVAAAVVACVCMAIPVVRAIPRGARGWALRFGSRIGGRVALLFGVPALLALATALSLADTHLPDEAKKSLSVLLRVLFWVGISMVWGLFRTRRKGPGPD